MKPLAVPLAGTILIEASAGTGKTRAITDLYVRLLVERRLRIGQILVVTFTNAATAELRDRVRRRVGDAVRAFENGDSEHEFLRDLVAARGARGERDADRRHLLGALRGFDEAAIFTIHGFCRRVLEEFAFESGAAFDTELISDQRPLLGEVVRDFWVRKLHDAPEDLVRYAASSGIWLGSLGRIAAVAVAHADMPVLPPPDKSGSPPGDDRAEGVVKAAAAMGEPELIARALALRLELVDYARTELRRRKERARVQSFDDLLQRLAEALRGPGGESLAARVRERFPVALIDEFQDTDPVQYEVFRRVYGGGGEGAGLFMIGDPKQAIYAFRGADVFAYLQAKRDTHGHPHTLDINRRSDPALVRGVNALFGRVKDPFLLAGIPFVAARPSPDARDLLAGEGGGQPPLRIMLLERDGLKGKKDAMINKPVAWRAATRMVAGDILRLLESDTAIDGRKVAPADIAVLCRTNKQALAMQEALRKRGVPSVLQSESSVFETGEAEEVERVVAALADPGDAYAIRAALATVILGQRAADLARIEVDEGAWDDWVQRFQSWFETWQRRGFVAAFRAMLAEQQVPARLLGFSDGERRLTNILHLMELLHTAGSEGRLGPEALVHWLHQMRTDKTAREEIAGDAEQIRLEDDAAAVMLTTVHKSKGLEYPIVYCPYLADGTLLQLHETKMPRFHDPGNGYRLTLDLGSPERTQHAEAAEKEALAEQVRLLYVALTRACHACTIVWGAVRGAHNSALGYVLHQQGCAGPKETASRIDQLFKSDDDDGILRDLRAIEACAPDGIGVVGPPPRSESGYENRPAAPDSLRCQTPTREISHRWRVASFSALAAARVAAGGPVEEGLDYDADEAPDEAVVAAQRGAEAPIVLSEFPAGARAGQLFHEVLERFDFRSADQAVLRELVGLTLARFGFETTWTEVMCRALAGVVASPFGDAASPLRLADIALDRRLSEVEFIFPVADRRAPADALPLTRERLAETLTQYGGPGLPRGYAERIRRLDFQPLAGFMKGAMDLVFEADGRWYLVDYKSNLLGRHPGDYRPARLLAAMVEHHYFLQYHLYAVALHLYLARRLPGYDYERHFGGVHYLFLRGMAPAQPAGAGVFSDRPPARLVKHLSEVLAGVP